MGCFCSCFRVPVVEESDEEDVVSNNQTCTPLSYFTKNFKNRHVVLSSIAGLQTTGSQIIHSSAQGQDIVTTDVGTNMPQGALLQNRSNSRNLELQGYDAVRGNGAGSGPLQLERIQTPEGHNSQVNLCSKSKDNAAGGHLKDNKAEARRFASPANVSSEKLKTEHKDDFCSTRDEVECPTCLEEYTDENPMITSKCNHHFHLGCIYEWMERSSACPICLEEMEFAENI